MNTNMTLEKRILSVLLTVIMVFSMLPIQVLGADGGAATVITSGGEVAFNVYKDAVAYANQHDGSTIKLQSDIDAPTYEDPADMPFITGNVTLDLNGKSINCVDIGSVSFDEEGEIFYVAGDITFVGNGGMNADPPRMISQQIIRETHLFCRRAVFSLLYILFHLFFTDFRF